LAVIIDSVERGSAAERAGVKAGETLLQINAHPIRDVLDYRFYMTVRRLELSLDSPGGGRRLVRIRKGEYEDLGLVFGTYLMDKQRFCKNKCVFCFIDQLPGGLRESLYFKDDDSRMSFLFGNYITLTNLEQRDVDRILEMHISPVNISVHTTNPDLRVRMMANPRAGQVLSLIPRLTGAGIRVNAQLVLCPGLNDGAELERSLGDLCALAPALQSLAVVPVGLTKHREGLPTLQLFTAREAARVIDTVDRFGDQALARHGQRICHAADELYLAAGRELPPASFYEDFAQLENGVGLLALLADEFRQALEDTPPHTVDRSVTIATGRAPCTHIRALSEAAMSRFPGLSVQVTPIDNDFFGHTITVAGLVTGGDLIAQLRGKTLGDALLLPAAMLRHEGDLFLDDVPVRKVERELRISTHPIENDGYILLKNMLGE